MLIKIEDGVPVGHPVTEDNFRQLHPQTVLPLVFSPDIVEPFGYAMFDFTKRPKAMWHQEVAETTPVVDEWGIWRQQWAVLDLQGTEQEVRIAQGAQNFARRVDAEADGIYRAVLGDRAIEYMDAETDAKAYRDAGYSGTVPVSVNSAVVAKGITQREAADEILTMSSGWRQAQQAIRLNRMAHKQQLAVATTVAAVDAAWSGWADFRDAVRFAMGIAELAEV